MSRAIANRQGSLLQAERTGRPADPHHRRHLIRTRGAGSPVRSPPGGGRAASRVGRLAARVADTHTVRTTARTRAGPITRSVRAHPLGSYIGLAFFVSWSYWITDIALGGDLSHFPGLLGPLVAAFVVSAVAGRRTGARALWRHVVHWRSAWRWYAAAAVPLLIAAVGVGVEAVRGDAPGWNEFGELPGAPQLGWLGVAAFTIVVNGFGEETGWRGFAWPLLRRHRTIGRAAVVLAVPWAAWHLPLFWIDSALGDMSIALILGFFAGMVAGAVVLGWLYERSGCSVPVVAVWHTMLNMASATTGTATVAPAVSIVVIVWAVVIVRAHPGRPPG